MARDLWLEEVDTNTKFFHRLANSQCVISEIQNALVGDKIIDTILITNGVVDYILKK